MTEEKKSPYLVLARKYRPQNFSEMIGQDALIRTLKNAIESGRIAHAFMLTGVRGTGKTTTARLIAKALNYAGPDGNAGPTAGPTDDCDICKAIAEDRHPDVMEMDAASRTGVDDIREILDGVRYAPSSARYKVYIIDEVHMLSKAAFNALLKTLEEPPEHVIFIFATTEIRKVPVTVLSRCQRFDLKRIDANTLAEYYGTLCEKENVEAEPEALAMIGRAADGSARDGLSLLDQAIVLGGGNVTAQLVHDMMGLSDRGRVLDILEHCLKGECAEALTIMDDMYANCADPAVLLQDMLDFTHILTKSKAMPKSGGDTGNTLPPDALERVKELSGKLSMPSLGRAWQILLKGIGEVMHAQNAQAAAEMVIIRLGYAADLPDPADILKKLQSGEAVSAGAPAAAAPSGERTGAPVAVQGISSGGGAGGSASAAVRAPVADNVPAEQASLNADPRTLAEIEEVLRLGGELKLATELYVNIHLVKLEEGKLEIRPEETARPELSSELARALTRLTERRWIVTVSGAAGSPTLAEQARQAEAQELEGVKEHPVVAEVLRVFPGAKVEIGKMPDKRAENDQAS